MLAIALAAITVSASFEAGTVGKVEHVSPAHLRCAVPGQSDQTARNRQASWYYFRLDGLPQTEVRVDLVDLVGEYNFRPGAHPVNKNTRPVFSYDDRVWQNFPDAAVAWDDKAAVLTLRFTPERPTMWIAHVPPYTGKHLAALLDEFRGRSELRQESVGKTVNGRPIPLLTITDPGTPDTDKKVIWLMARQHAWETGTSLAAEGAVRLLLSKTPEGAALRKAIVWKIFPVADPDGVASGAVRFNAHGYDLNRNWDVVDERLMPEITAQRKAITDWVDSGRRIDLFLALHDTESTDYVNGCLSAGGPAMRALAERFTSALNEGTSFYDPRSPRDSSPGAKVQKGRMTVNQALYTSRRIPAFLMEIMVERNPKLGRPRNTDDFLTFGRGLAKAMAAAVQAN